MDFTNDYIDEEFGKAEAKIKYLSEMISFDDIFYNPYPNKDLYYFHEGPVFDFIFGEDREYVKNYTSNKFNSSTAVPLGMLFEKTSGLKTFPIKERYHPSEFEIFKSAVFKYILLDDQRINLIRPFTLLKISNKEFSALINVIKKSSILGHQWAYLNDASFETSNKKDDLYLIF